MTDLYKHRDNDLSVTILSEETNSVMNPLDFDNAIYAVYQGATEVYRADLTDNVSVVGNQFNIRIPKESMTFDNSSNQHRHTFVVGYTSSEERPSVFDEDVNVIDGLDL